MDSLQEFLEKVGLTDIEIRIYMKLLEKGHKSVQELAQLVGMNRTTMYNYMNPLLEKGLVIRTVKGSHTLFSAATIDESLENLVKDKITAAQQVQEEFPTILQKIHTLFPQQEEDGNFEVKYYKGKNGVRKIYEDALNSKEVRAYANLELILNYLPENKEIFGRLLEQNENLVVYEILTGSEGTLSEAKKYDTNPRYHYKILPQKLLFLRQIPLFMMEK